MTELIQLAGNFGAPGLLIAFMVWQQRERKETDMFQQRERKEIDEKRIAADVRLAEVLAAQAVHFSDIKQTLTERLR